MFPTVPAVLFTIVFVATAVVALGRYVRLSAAYPSGPGSGSRARAIELMHLLMSVAMIAMAWGWSGGPTTGSGIVQLAVFGSFTVLFLVLTARAATTSDMVVVGSHALMATAMVWMVAAMPLLMGHATTGDGDAGGHAGHGGHADMAPMDGSTTPAADAPPWALVLNALLAALLVAAAGLWAARLLRALRGRDAGTATTATPGARGPRPDGAPDSAPSGALATLAPPDASAVDARTCADADHGRLTTACHALMSLGMAAMLLLMA